MAKEIEMGRDNRSDAAVSPLAPSLNEYKDLITSLQKPAEAVANTIANAALKIIGELKGSDIASNPGAIMRQKTHQESTLSGPANKPGTLHVSDVKPADKLGANPTRTQAADKASNPAEKSQPEHWSILGKATPHSEKPQPAHWSILGKATPDSEKLQPAHWSILGKAAPDS